MSTASSSGTWVDAANGHQSPRDADVHTRRPVLARMFGSAFTFVRSDSTLMVGSIMLVAIVALMVLGPVLVSADPQATGPDILADPSGEHLLGTDSVGRDMLARTVVAVTSSILIAVSATALTMVVGVGLGLLSGYSGRWIDWGLMRIVDMMLAVPTLLIAVALLAAVGPSVPALVLVIVSTYVPQTVRVVRSGALQLRDRPFIQSAQISGVSRRRIMVRHLLPNLRGIVIVQTTITVAHMLLLEMILSFLGLGVQPPTPSLGFMVSEGRQWMEFAPWVVIVPGTVAIYAVFTFTLVGEGVDRALTKRS